MSRTGAPEPVEELPYSVELWHIDGVNTVERVLGRSLNVQLAHAIFKAAAEEHPARRITMREGTRVIADSSR
jgi:F0F1-type ATP synthase gamma subunit